MKDYNNTFIFANGITITPRLDYKSSVGLRLYLDYDFLFDYNYKITRLRLQFDCINSLSLC